MTGRTSTRRLTAVRQGAGRRTTSPLPSAPVRILPNRVPAGPAPRRVGSSRDVRARVIDEVPPTVGQNDGDQQEELLLQFAAPDTTGACQRQVSAIDAFFG